MKNIFKVFFGWLFLLLMIYITFEVLVCILGIVLTRIIIGISILAVVYNLFCKKDNKNN